MRYDNRGFTLIELLVVTIMLTVMVAIAIPKLARTVEASRAHDTMGVLNAVGSGVRMFRSDWGGTTLAPSTALTTALNTATCPVGGKPASVSDLLGCKYIQPQDWDNLRYQIFVCEGGAPSGSCCASSAIACADRRDTDPQSGSATDDNYRNWVYWIDTYGGCHATTFPGQPSCPRI